MKNLHKKIGAMVLAGMVVLGGVAAGGVNSFAASKDKVCISNKVKNLQKIKVENSIKNYGILLEESSDEKEIDNIKNEKYKNKKWNRKSIKVKSQCDIPLILIKASKGPRKIVKIEFRDIYYLIEAK